MKSGAWRESGFLVSARSHADHSRRGMGRSLPAEPCIGFLASSFPPTRPAAMLLCVGTPSAGRTWRIAGQLRSTPLLHQPSPPRPRSSAACITPTLMVTSCRKARAQPAPL